MELIAATRVAKARLARLRPVPMPSASPSDRSRGRWGRGEPPAAGPGRRPRQDRCARIAADRLAGAFNSAVIKAAEREVAAARSENRDYALVTVGRKPADYFRFRNYPIEAEFGFSDKPTFEDAAAVAARVSDLSPTAAANGSCWSTRASSRWVPRNPW
ncbi:MAG: F0F1 ATP synthase subunit gamma [Microthrixaceae bacterium]